MANVKKEFQELQERQQGFQELQERQQGFQELQERQQGFQELPKLFFDFDGFPIDFLVKPDIKTLKNKDIKIYSKEERTEKIRRFKDKKLRRQFNRGTLYISRRIFAISRPRRCGRFTKL
jgi:hypothetical protein